MRVLDNKGIRYFHDIFSNEIAIKEHIITRRIDKLILLNHFILPVSNNFLSLPFQIV